MEGGEGKKGCVRKGCLRMVLLSVAALAVFLIWPVGESDSIVLDEDFNDNDHEWPIGGTSFIEDGRLVMSAGESAILFSGIELARGRIQADLYREMEDEHVRWGIVFRGGEEGQTLFLIDGRRNFYLSIPGEEPVTEEVSYIRDDDVNSIDIRLYGRHGRIFINGELLIDFYDPAYMPGSVALFSSGEGTVAFDNLIIEDYDLKDPNLEGSVTVDGDGYPGAIVTAWQVLNFDPLQTAVAATATSDKEGTYRFYLDDEFGYVVSAEDPQGKLYGDRFADLQVSGSGDALNISLREGGRP